MQSGQEVQAANTESLASGSRPATTSQNEQRAAKEFSSRPMNDTQVQLANGLRQKLESIWADADAIQQFSHSTETKRLIAIAKTDLESAGMWLTKAISRG